MGATVVFDRARAKWFLVDRHPKHQGGRQKWVLGRDDVDRDRGLAAAQAINTRRREAANAKSDLFAGAQVLGAHALTTWWDGARPGFADSTRVTDEGYLRLHLHPFFDGLDLAALTREQIKAFAGGAADRGLGQHAVKGALSVLRRVLRWLVEQRILERVPVERLVAIGVEAAAARGAQLGARDAFTHGEAAHLLDLASGSPLFDIVFAASQSGARKGELLELKWPCVNFDRNEIEWRESRWHTQSKATKANNIRRSTMSPELAALLRVRALERFAQSADHVFLDREKKAWIYDSLSTAWKRLQKRALAKYGVRPLPFHSWRHTYVSWALAGGADVLWVAQQIGDRPETMLRTYAHFLRGRPQPLDFLRISQAPPAPETRPLEAALAPAASDA